MTDKQYLSVTALTQYIKRKFDADPYLDRVWVVGEVSNFRLRAGGHQYFSLKDDNAKISVVMYRHKFDNVKFTLEEGMRVVIMGKVSVYNPSGQYQLTAEVIEPDGVGALYQAYLQLKEKLTAEGLFSLPKKPVAPFPKRIAVITSPSGAVIQDILTTVERRYPFVKVTVFPTQVQGATAAGEIVSAFQLLSTVESQYDGVILARGGGSMEDLWCFNDERVVRAIAASSLPVVSSIGHETDTTLSDLVADVRAATPTAAAEIMTPSIIELRQQVLSTQSRLMVRIDDYLQRAIQRLRKAQTSYILQYPERLYLPYNQQLDDMSERLNRAYCEDIMQRQNRLDRLLHALQLHHPQRLLVEASHNLTLQSTKLQRDMIQLVEKKQQQLMRLTALLDAYSPLKVLARGYAVAYHDERVVKQVRQINVGDAITLQFVDGTADAVVNAVDMQSDSE